MRYANKTTRMRTIYLKDGSGIFLMRGQSAEVEESEILKMSDGIVEVSDDARAPTSKSRKTRRSKTSETEESVSEENF